MSGLSAGRNALAAIGVLLGLGALVAVPAAISAGLPDEGPLPAGDRLAVGYGVSVRPPSDARLDLASSRPGAGEVILLTHGLRLRLRTVDVPRRPADFVAHTRRKFTRDDGLLPGPAQPVTTDDGVRGERGDLRPDDGGAISGDPGCYGVFVAESIGVVAVVSAVSGCAAVPAAVWATVASLEFSPAEDG